MKAKASNALADAVMVNPTDDQGNDWTLKTLKDSGSSKREKWIYVFEFIISALEKGIKNATIAGDISLCNQLQESLRGFQELAENWKGLNGCICYSNLGNQIKKEFDLRSAVQARVSKLQQERRRLAEAVEQARNVSQGASAGVQAVAGAGNGASIKDQMDAINLNAAERMAAFEVKTAEANFQKETLIAALDVKYHENTVETHEMINKNNVAISQSNVEISELKVGHERFKLELAKTDATANRAERKADSANGKADEALESFKNVDERVDGIEDKVYGLEDTVKKCVRAEIAKSRVEVDGVNEDDNDPYASLGGNASFSPAYDSSRAAAVDDSFDEDEVPNNNIITPGSTSFAARLFPDDDAAAAPDFRAFLRLLKDASSYGGDGMEEEMNSSLKKAEQIMRSTKLNEERNLWTSQFRIFSESARKRCSQYGLKPPAR